MSAASQPTTVLERRVLRLAVAMAKHPDTPDEAVEQALTCAVPFRTYRSELADSAVMHARTRSRMSAAAFVSYLTETGR